MFRVPLFLGPHVQVLPVAKISIGFQVCPSVLLVFHPPFTLYHWWRSPDPGDRHIGGSDFSKPSMTAGALEAWNRRPLKIRALTLGRHREDVLMLFCQI